MGGEGKKRDMPDQGCCKHTDLRSTWCPPLYLPLLRAPSCSTQCKCTAKPTWALQLSLRFIWRLSVVLGSWALLGSWRRQRLWEMPQRGGRGLFTAGTPSMTWNCPAEHVSKVSQVYEQSPVTAAEHKQCCLSLKYLLKVGRIDTVICLEKKKCCELEQRCLRDQSALHCVWHCCPHSYVCYK